MVGSNCKRGLQSHVICSCKPVGPLPPKRNFEIVARVKTKRECPAHD